MVLSVALLSCDKEKECIDCPGGNTYTCIEGECVQWPYLFNTNNKYEDWNIDVRTGYMTIETPDEICTDTIVAFKTNTQPEPFVGLEIFTPYKQGFNLDHANVKTIEEDHLLYKDNFGFFCYQNSDVLYYYDARIYKDSIILTITGEFGNWWEESEYIDIKLINWEAFKEKYDITCEGC